MTRTRKLLWAGLFLLMGIGAAGYLHWPALEDPLVYKSDVRQSPHWSAYHTDTFRDNDLILTLATHNESPLQNLIYWVGTLFVDMVLLGKLLAVFGYGLVAALFFWIGHSLFGFRAGALASICITFFPDQFEYCAGGFSKAWMIPLILLCVYLLERRAWRGLLLLMPLGAVAYPVSAVLMGAITLAFVLLELPEKRREVRPLFVTLCGASALAVAVLSVKYFFPADGIGSLTPGDVLESMPEMRRGGMFRYLPLPTFTAEMTHHVEHPFIILSAVVFLVVLGRSGIWWSRSMTALLVASMTFYVLADLTFMHLYQPNRYTRYSLVVLLALWHARNWDRVLERIRRRWLRLAALAGGLALGGYLFQDSFYQGKDTSPRHEWAPLNEFIATLPPGVLIAGPPKYMDDIPIQAKRSVLCNYKLAHPWYSEYYDEIRIRTWATFDALYAGEPRAINRLADEWGVTHLVVVRRYLTPERIESADTYVDPYNDYIYDLAIDREEILLREPPEQSIVYEDDELYVIELPLEVPASTRSEPDPAQSEDFD